MKAIWLADVLRDAGLKVTEVDGWRSRGQGELSAVRGVILHHTGTKAYGHNAPSLHLIRDGRSDLPGPLSQLLLGRDGTFYVVAAGRCNHAGKGRWHGITSGNSEFIGIEAENDGVGEAWPDRQMDAYATGVAAILTHIGADSTMACGHKEWALPKGRKIDPNFDMVEFREAVEGVIGGDKAPLLPRSTAPERSMLRKGDHDSDSVRLLQRRLCIPSDGDFGSKTEAAVKAFQKLHGLKADGKVGPATWAALGE